MLTALQRSGGIEALARQAGLAPPDALAAARKLLPALLAAFRGYSAGREELLASLERLGGIGLAAEVMSVEPARQERGRALLDEMPLAGDAGEGPLAPLLAMLVGGYVAARAAGHGSDQGGIEELLKS